MWQNVRGINIKTGLFNSNKKDKKKTPGHPRPGDVSFRNKILKLLKSSQQHNPNKNNSSSLQKIWSGEKKAKKSIKTNAINCYGMKSSGRLNPPFLFMYCLYFLSILRLFAYTLFPSTCLPLVVSKFEKPIICCMSFSSSVSPLSGFTGITGGFTVGLTFFFVGFWTPRLPPRVRACALNCGVSCLLVDEWWRSPSPALPNGDRSRWDLLGDLDRCLLLGDLDFLRGERLLRERWPRSRSRCRGLLERDLLGILMFALSLKKTIYLVDFWLKTT